MKRYRAFTFLASISLLVCLVFIGIAHESERHRLQTEVQMEKKDVEDAKKEVRKLEDKGYARAIGDGMTTGMLTGIGGGIATGALLGNLPAAITGGASGGVVGGVAGSIAVV